MKSALKKSGDSSKITSANYTVKLRQDLATLLTLPPKETPTPFVFRESHQFKDAADPLFLAGFSNDWKKYIKTNDWLKSPENTHTWLGSCVRNGDEMHLTVRKGKLKQPQFRAAIKKNSALKKLTWHITEMLEEGEDDDLLNDDLHEMDDSIEQPSAPDTQPDASQQQVRKLQVELVDLLKQLKGATPEAKRVILGNVEQIAAQLYQIPNWTKYTDDKIEGYLEQVETFLAQQNQEEASTPSLADELNRIHRSIEQEVAAFPKAATKEEKTAILSKIIKLLGQWDTTAESAIPEDFTDEQRVEIPKIKAQIKKIAPNAPIKEDSIPSAIPEVAQEEPKQPIQLQVTVHVHNLPTFTVAALDTDTVQVVLDKIANNNLQRFTALRIGGTDVIARRDETLQQLGIQADTDLIWAFDANINAHNTWNDALWNSINTTATFKLVADIAHKNNRPINDVSSLAALSANIEKLTPIKTNLTQKVQTNQGFVNPHSDKDILRIINQAAALGLDDDKLKDLLFISCRAAKSIDANTLIQQMDNYVNDITKRGYPYRFGDADTQIKGVPQLSATAEFQRFSTSLKDGIRDLNLPIDDIRIQGSSLRKPTAGDVDLVVMISEVAFDGLVKAKFSNKITKKTPTPVAAFASKKQLANWLNSGIGKPTTYIVLQKDNGAIIPITKENKDELANLIWANQANYTLSKIEAEPLDISGFSHQELADLARDTNDNPTLYNGVARNDFYYTFTQRIINAKPDKGIIAGHVALLGRIQTAFPDLNIENIAVQTRGGAFDLEPFMKL